MYDAVCMVLGGGAGFWLILVRGGVYNNIDNIDVFKDIVAGLDEKIRMLTEDINFLRRDAESKNNIISQLTKNYCKWGRYSYAYK